jgi:hypothetical protein
MMPMAMENLAMPNTKIIFYGMPQDDTKIIGLEYVDLS